MHKLSRQIRFAIEPFSNSAEIGSAKLIASGANSYCAKPASDSLSLFFALWVELAGNTSNETGFIVNVSDIDKVIRNKAIGIIDDSIKKHFNLKKNVTFEEIGELLVAVWKKIQNDFLPARITGLSIELMPARKLGIKEIGGDMMYFSEKFEFSASHTLWNEKFSDVENEKIFGKCANKTGHGHNYIVEVTIKKSTGGEPLQAGNFEQTVNEQFIQIVDHRNLNADVGYFKKVNPTVENIAEFAFKSLSDKLKPMELDCVTVWENDRTFCSYRAD